MNRYTDEERQQVTEGEKQVRGGNELIESITHEGTLRQANQTTRGSFPGNLTMDRYARTRGGAYSANVEVSTAGPSSNKRKRESTEGKRKRSEVAEPLPSWQPTTSLQALNATMPSSLYQQQAAVNQDIVKPTPLSTTSFFQQSTPMIAGLPPRFPQSMMQNMSGPNINSIQMAHLQQCLLATQLQSQQLLKLRQQQQLQMQRLLQQQQQQQLQLQQYQQQKTQQKQSQKKPRQQRRQQQQYQQNQQQQQQYQQNQQQQYQPNQMQQQQSQQNQQQQQQYQLNQPQEQQSRKNQQEQQPTVNYFNPQLQRMAASTISMDTSQIAPKILSPWSSGRGELNEMDKLIKEFQVSVLQEILEINMPASLEISLVRSSQNATPTPQNFSLHNTALFLQKAVSNSTKSRSDNGGPLPRALSPITSSSSSLRSGQNPFCRVQSPLSGLLAPPSSSTPNPFWQQHEEQQRQQNEQQQQRQQNEQQQQRQQNEQQQQRQQNEQQQQRQQNEQQQQYQQRQYENQEIMPDSAYQSQNNQSSSVPPGQDRPRSPDQLENVDGYKCDDFDMEQAADVAVLNLPLSIMMPLNIRSKRIKVQNDPVDLRINLVNDSDQTAVVPKTEPIDDLLNWIKNENEPMKEETSSPRVKEFCNESHALDYGNTQRIYSLISRGISLENKENEMNVYPAGGSKRGKRKGKNNGKRAIKKKHSKKTVTVKKECVKLEPVDIELIKEALPPITEECDVSRSLEVECQTEAIVFADNEKKRKRTLDLDTSNVFKCRFQPNQMVSLAADWLSLFNGDESSFSDKWNRKQLKMILGPISKKTGIKLLD